MARTIPQSVGAAWLDIYTAALIELDREKLKTLIDDASEQSPSAPSVWTPFKMLRKLSAWQMQPTTCQCCGAKLGSHRASR
jgi:hypothetical protein